jgi:hypothetical protein
MSRTVGVDPGPPTRVAVIRDGRLHVVSRSEPSGADSAASAITGSDALRVARLSAERLLGDPVDGAVVLAPAWYSVTGRAAMAEIGRRAGFSSVRMRSRPVAAALALLENTEAPRTLAVIDVGPSGLGIAVLECGDGVLEVKATGWRRYPPLTNEENVSALLEQAGRDVLGRLRLAPMQYLGDVYLVGPWAAPGLLSAAARGLGQPATLADLPRDVAVRGAAKMAGSCDGILRDVLVLETTSWSLGVETLDGRFEAVVPHGTTIPTRQSCELPAWNAGASWRARAVEREDGVSAESRIIFDLEIDPAAGSPHGAVELIFDLDSDGHLHVEAHDRSIGRRVPVRAIPPPPRCRSCKAPAAPGDAFCGSCGHPLDE